MISIPVLLDRVGFGREHALRQAIPACRALRLAGGLAALGCALLAPDLLVVTDLRPGAWTLSPLRAALVGVTFVWALTTWRHRAYWLSVLVVLTAGAAVAGATPSDMADRLSRWGAWLRDTPGSLLPSSLLQWGVVILVLAFVLLVVGSIVSWRKPDRPQVPVADKRGSSGR